MSCHCLSIDPRLFFDEKYSGSLPSNDVTQVLCTATKTATEVCGDKPFIQFVIIVFLTLLKFDI